MATTMAATVNKSMYLLGLVLLAICCIGLEALNHRLITTKHSQAAFNATLGVGVVFICMAAWTCFYPKLTQEYGLLSSIYVMGVTVTYTFGVEQFAISGNKGLILNWIGIFKSLGLIILNAVYAIKFTEQIAVLPTVGVLIDCGMTYSRNLTQSNLEGIQFLATMASLVVAAIALATLHCVQKRYQEEDEPKVLMAENTEEIAHNGVLEVVIDKELNGEAEKVAQKKIFDEIQDRPTLNEA